MRQVRSIMLAAGVYPPDIGGPATYAAMVAEELPKRGVAVKVLPFHSVRKIPKLLRHLVYFARLYKSSAQADIIFATDGVSVGLPAWCVAKLRRRPLWVRLGGDYAWEQGVQRFGVTDTLDEFTAHAERAYSWPVRVLAALQRFVVARAECVIVPSQYLRSVVSSWEGVKEDRIHVLYSVLDPLPNANEARSVGERSFTILTAGRLVPWKGVDGVIKAIEDVPEVQLYIAGDGPERTRLEELTKHLKLGERVSLLGALDRQRLSNLLATVDVFVLNTKYEGLSHMLLEVMAAGVPIVTTSVGGNPELIKDGESGRLLAPDDVVGLRRVINELQANNDLGLRYATEAKRAAKAFTKDNSVTELYRLFETVI